MIEARVEPSREIWYRDDFSLLCFWRKLYRVVEVGVDRGTFAATFLARFPMCAEWWGVDAYLPYPEMDYDRTADYHMALSRLAPYAHCAKLIRLSSGEAARRAGPASFDFIYIDGAHDYKSVVADLAAWFPKLAEGGILAGHDWTDKPEHEGVKRAVLEFAAEHDRTVYLTAVPPYNIEDCPSWYIYRDGMPGPDWRRC
jgi:predicted O-methyltransferase YrrM